jgi:hypothetical protein
MSLGKISAVSIVDTNVLAVEWDVAVEPLG